MGKNTAFSHCISILNNICEQWLNTTSGSYGELSHNILKARGMLERSNRDPKKWGLNLVIQILEDDIFPRLSFLIEVETLLSSKLEKFDTAFSAVFQIGPHGIQPMINLLFDVFSALLKSREANHISADEYTSLLATLELYAQSLLSLILHFRSNTPREDYNPPGFSNL